MAGRLSTPLAALSTRPARAGRTTARAHSSSSSGNGNDSDHEPRPGLAAPGTQLPRMYTTLDAVQDALHTPRYAALRASGWHAHSRAYPPGVVLRKHFPPRQPFGSWDAVLAWLHDHLRPLAAELDHHPDISISNFNHLTLSLCTHSCNALTPRDFRLALRIDQLLPRKTPG